MKHTKQQNNQNKLRNKFLKAGVKMTGPETVFFSNDTKIGKNVTIEPYVVFGSKVKIKNNVKILAFSHLEGVSVDNNVSIGAGAVVRDNLQIGEGASLAMGSVVVTNVQSHTSVVGVPAIEKATKARSGPAL